MSDLSKLITLGKMQETYQADGVTIVMETPVVSDEMLSGQVVPPLEMLISTIVQVGDKKIDDDASRQELREILRKMQSMVVAKLISLMTDMLNRQQEMTEGIVSKKA